MRSRRSWSTLAPSVLRELVRWERASSAAVLAGRSVVGRGVRVRKGGRTSAFVAVFAKRSVVADEAGGGHCDCGVVVVV